MRGLLIRVFAWSYTYAFLSLVFLVLAAIINLKEFRDLFPSGSTLVLCSFSVTSLIFGILLEICDNDSMNSRVTEKAFNVLQWAFISCLALSIMGFVAMAVKITFKIL